MTALTMLVTYKAKPGMRQTYVQQLRSSGILKKSVKKTDVSVTTFIFRKKMKTPCFW